MKKQFSEGQIIGLLRKADKGAAVDELLCCQHGFVGRELLPVAVAEQVQRNGGVGCEACDGLIAKYERHFPGERRGCPTVQPRSLPAQRQESQSETAHRLPGNCRLP